MEKLLRIIAVIIVMIMATVFSPAIRVCEWTGLDYKVAWLSLAVAVISGIALLYAPLLVVWCAVGFGLCALQGKYKALCKLL